MSQRQARLSFSAGRRAIGMRVWPPRFSILTAMFWLRLANTEHSTATRTPITDPLLHLLISKGLLTEEARLVISYGSTAQQRDRLAILLKDKGLISTADRDKLVVWIETDRWLADAVEAVTGARLAKRTLKFLDYGKLAATFLNRETGKAVRIVALESSRRLADQRHPEIEDKYERQMRTYREAAEEELFGVTHVEVQVRAKDLPGHPRSRAICHKCGEGVNDGREISLPDRINLCRPCVYGTYGTYYQPQHKSVGRTWLTRPRLRLSAFDECD